MMNNQLRYIVFGIWTGPKEIKHADYHEGQIFTNREDAKEYAEDLVQNQLLQKYVIGSFVMDIHAESMYIGDIQTFGFKNDVTKTAQLSLFENVKEKTFNHRTGRYEYRD